MGRLVLDRKVGTGVRIGEAVVTVVRVSGTRVKLSIEADQIVRVTRIELERKDAA